MSHSGLTKYLNCPFKYKIRYLDGISMPGNIFTAFGHSIHSTCEGLLKGEIIDFISFFQNNFEDEITDLPLEYKQRIFNPKDEKDKGLKPILQDMMQKGGWLSDRAIKALSKQFGKFKIIDIEAKILEPITDYNVVDYEFKGIIDLIIQTEDEIYHVIDWKSCSWGWLPKKKTAKLTTYQLSFYKHFFTLANDINPLNTQTWFVLIKRTAFNTNKETGKKTPKDDIIEFVPVSNGPRKIINALEVLNKVVYNVDHGMFPKNKTHCKFCDYHKTRWCP